MYSYDRTAVRVIPIDKLALAKLAKELVHKLPAHLKFRPADMDDPLWRVRGFTANWGYSLGEYEVTDVRGFPVIVPLTVGAKNAEANRTRNYIAGGGVKTRYYGPKAQGHKMALYVNINSEKTPNELLSRLRLVEKEAFSVIIHEVTHLKDVLRYSGPEDTTEDKAKGYYNDAQEVRAFMQQVVDEVLAEVERQAKSIGIGNWGLQLDSRLVDSALKASATWERIQDTMGQRNKQLILKAVARAIRDEWSRLSSQFGDD